MKFIVLKILDRMRAWTARWAHTPHMASALFFIAFIEASIFPIPPDILMIAILLIGSQRWWWYAGLTTLGSVLGALLGYAIGWGFYEAIGYRIVEIYDLRQGMEYIGAIYQKHSLLAIFSAALTPIIPFKLITITAGLFKVSLWQLIFVSIFGRGIRYFVIAYLVKVFGERTKQIVAKYFNIFSIVFIVLLFAISLIIKFLWQR